MLLKLYKIKNKISSILNKKYIFIGSLLLFLVIPFVTEAAIGTGIFDFFSSVLEGISETAIPFKLFFIFLLLALIFSKVALEFSVFLLERAADPANLEIMESEMVQIGWQFTSSLANTAIIIILIVIGIATILNKESYGAKKALPKLIIAALLVNFSLVFVSAIVDISNIILMTFFDGGIGEQITGALSQSWGAMASSMWLYLSASLTAFAIPFSAPFAQLAFVGSMTGFFLPQILDALMQTITTFIIAGTLLTYSLLFLARIFVIQILAIASPLAFIAWTIPDTKKLWDRWLNALVGWASLGVVLLFFLLLSTIAVAPLRPDDPTSVFDGSTIFSGQISTIFIYYLMLAVFLIITAKVSKDFMPDGAKAVIDGVKKAKDGFQQVAAPMTKPIKRSIAEEATDEKIQERQQRLEENDYDNNLAGVAKMQSDVINQTIGKFARRSSMSKFGGVSAPENKLDNDNSEFTENATDEELKKEVRKDSIPDSRKIQSIEKLAEDGNIDDDEIKEIIVEYWDQIDDDIQDDLKKARPDIHLDLADSMEEGMENMIDEINNMKPSETKDIKLDDMDFQFRNVTASILAQNGAVVQSWGDSSRNQKQLLIDSLEGSSEEVMQAFEDNVSKNAEKWSGLYNPTDEGVEDDDNENESSGGSDFNPNSTSLTDDEKNNFWGNN